MSQYPNWFVLYTKGRHEKKVYESLQEGGFTAYLPLRKELKQWSDRKKWVEQPLFTSYVFVYINDDAEYLKALQIKGASWFVTFRGRPATIPEKQIDLIRYIIDSEKPFELDNSRFDKGQKVLITEGGFEGMEGEIVHFKGKERLSVRLESLEQNMILELESWMLKSV